ncbi:hypothetical protein OAO87_01150, partial [bacterium]|nr:hypothetical protein [bacterium]
AARARVAPVASAPSPEPAPPELPPAPRPSGAAEPRLGGRAPLPCDDEEGVTTPMDLGRTTSGAHR